MEDEEFAALRDEELPELDSREGLRVEASPPAPQVNLLANLIRWVAKAKKEIGDEQLPTFLEVYGIGGNLSPDLKEVILHLAEITSEQSADASTTDIWSQLILELHGILVEGGLSLQPVNPLCNMSEIIGENTAEQEEVNEEEKPPKNKPLKLKVVYPQADGSEQEFTIDLNPGSGGESSPGQSPESGEAKG